MDKFYFQWHITNRCNNRCKHCYQELYEPIEVNLEAVKYIISDVNDFCEKIECKPKFGFVGGDPFLHSEFFKILDMAKEISNDINILGNPEKLLENSNNIKKLKEINIKCYQLSLDGMRDTHDYIRYKGSFDNTIKAIKLLSDNNIDVQVMSTISRTNYKEMKDVMNIAYKNGAKSWTFARCITKDQTLLLNKHEYKSFLEEMVESHKKYESRGVNRLEKEPLLSIIYNQIEEDKNCNIAGCGIGGPNLTIMPNLEIMACRRHPGSNLGKWSKDNNFLKIFLFNEKMNQFRELDKIDKCGSCELLKKCKGCRAMSYVQNGSIFASDPQCFLY